MSGSISPWPVVKSGSNGHPIKTLQYLLRARGRERRRSTACSVQTQRLR